jgi:hypothetical protein
MLDIALLTANASQLKYVLQVGHQHEFYTLMVWLISISIVLQVCDTYTAALETSYVYCTANRLQIPRHTGRGNAKVKLVLKSPGFFSHIDIFVPALT